MKQVYALCFLLLVVSAGVTAQTYKGPRSGSVPSGVTVTTNSFLPAGRAEFPGPLFAEPKNKISPAAIPPPPNVLVPSAPAGSNFMKDRSVEGLTSNRPPIALVSTQGIPDEAVLGYTYIPPDPYVAVGPNHVLATVNTRFRIIDKAGNSVKTIAGDSWFSTVYPVTPANGVFDPKIVYDHYANRWVMVWLQQSNSDSTSHFLLSVSDDSDPNGTWYNWALPANVLGDSVTGNWADYEGLGYDENAIYLTSNQWSFSGFFRYTRLRIIPKAQLYANADPPGPVTWTDFWDLRDETGLTVPTVRPSIMYTTAPGYLLVGMPNLTTGSYFAVFAVTDPIGTPDITVSNFPVTAWTNAPNAGQLGGSSILLEAGGERVRFEPVYRDSSLWIVHSVASGTGGQFSSVRYVRINVLDPHVVEDQEFGADGFWYYYPALVVDQNKNIAITYTRSGSTEYPGAYMTFRLNTDPPGLRPGVTIQPGLANYVKDFGTTRNRWGDYNGAAIDPADPSNIWLFTEYAASPVNTWGTWFYNARLVPYPGKRMWMARSSFNFGLTETGQTSDTSIVLFNFGDSPLTISSISSSQASYQFPGLPSLPLQLNTYDSVIVHIRFAPTVHGVVADSVEIASDDQTAPVTKIAVTGKGVLIGRAVPGIAYVASNGGTSAGSLYSMNLATGSPTSIGSLGVTEIQGLAIRPSTKELYGTLSTTATTALYRLSTGFGDALLVRTFPVANIRAIAFTLTGDTLYGATKSGDLYILNLATGDTLRVGSAVGVAYSSLAFSPTSGKLWASVRPNLSGRDKIYTVNTTTGAATLVGATGFGTVNAGIAFDMLGKLYAVTGLGTQTNTLISIDTVTAAGTLIGSTGLTNLNAIIMRTDSLQTGVAGRGATTVPSTFVLEQNFPNPFNPTTEIRFGLPVQSDVTLTVYTITGQTVVQLLRGSRAAGYHTVQWDGRTQSGKPVASGVYVYRLDARPSGGGSGGAITQIKKMVLLR